LNTYINEQVLAKTHAIVFNTGLYYDALEKRDEVPIGCDNFCKHMIQTQTQLQTKRTSKQQGYGLAVEQIQELTENFCNFVTHERIEKENDWSTINLLRHEMSVMQALIEQLQNKSTQQPQNQPRKPFVDQGSYCSMQGFAVTKNHTSHTCHTKAPGHKYDVTCKTTMGGSQQGKQQA
jgi:hypothetical protein